MPVPADASHHRYATLPTTVRRSPKLQVRPSLKHPNVLWFRMLLMFSANR